MLSVFGCSVVCVVRSDWFIELIIFLKSSNLSARIRTPAFVNPVYPSDVTNSLIVSPGFPPKSSTRIMISVSSFFFILPMSFSIL